MHFLWHAVKCVIPAVYLLQPLCCTSQGTAGFGTFTFTYGEFILPYRLLTPEHTSSNTRFPLVLFLHDADERGTDNVKNLKHISDLMLDSASRKGLPSYVLVPQCPQDQRWAPDDWYAGPSPLIRALVQLMDSIVLTCPVDTTRIYVMGASMGGFGTWYMITRYPDKFAAAVPIGGGGDWNQARLIYHVPIWAFHGRKDKVVPPEQSRQMVRALRKSGARPRYTEYKRAGHDSWTPAFKEPELLPWMFNQKRKL